MARDPVRARFLRTQLRFETLEDRSVPAASITAGLAGGVLTVNGTSKADSIVFKLSGQNLSVNGVKGTFATSKVQSVVVNTGGGNDSVNLAALKGWTKAITVNNAAGTDSVRGIDNRAVTLTASAKTLKINSGGGGGSSPGGGSSGWFDANVQDTALRQLLKQGFTDNLLSRNEMLAAFDQVEQDGTVSTTEFSDLQKVANNSSLFGSFTYVADLTRNVVLGNAANAKFQGTTLGNLTANSAGSKLDKLVGKWFLGVDRPDASYSGLTVSYTVAAGTLFGAGGPQYTDVRQGAVGDCYFVGTLAEIAQQTPQAIQDMFIVNGDGSYGVRFYQNGQERFVTVDSQLPTYAGGYLLYASMGQHASNSSNVLWVALAEKAYVQMNEAGWLRPANWGGGLNSYQAIAGGWFADVAFQVTNRVAMNYSIGTKGITVSTFEAAYNSGKMIGLGSVTNPSNSSVVGNHQYTVVGYNSSTKTVTLFNPWGINNGTSKPGLISLTLSQLTSNFNVWAAA
jgi:hypothetical protein